MFTTLFQCCHVLMDPWLIITGSGLDDWIYWHLLLQSLLITITTARNKWLHKTRSILAGLWLASLLACLVMWLISFRVTLRLSSALRMTYEWRTNPFSLILRPTVRRPVCLGIDHPSRAYDQIFITVKTVAGLLIWGALSDGRTDLSFTIAAGPHHRSHSRVRFPWDSRPYFTVSDSRLPFSSPLTSRRVTVEVFDLASTRGEFLLIWLAAYIPYRYPRKIYVDRSYPWTRLLIPQQRFGFQQSTTSIPVSKDTFV
jgi:hypothetical protein